MQSRVMFSWGIDYSIWYCHGITSEGTWNLEKKVMPVWDQSKCPCHFAPERTTLLILTSWQKLALPWLLWVGPRTPLRCLGQIFSQWCRIFFPAAWREVWKRKVLSGLVLRELVSAFVTMCTGTYKHPCTQGCSKSWRQTWNTKNRRSR